MNIFYYDVVIQVVNVLCILNNTDLTGGGMTELFPLYKMYLPNIELELFPFVWNIIYIYIYTSEN